MQETISGRLKLMFLIHAVIGIVVGLGFLLIPAQLGDWFNVPIEADFTYRLVGDAILSFGVSSALGYMQKNFEQVRLILEVEIFWTLMAALVLLWAGFKMEVIPPVIAEQENMTQVLLFGSGLLMALFFFVFGYFFMTEERPETTETRERGYAH